MLWVVFALLHSLMRAAYTETGRLFQVDSWLMTFWQAVFGVIILCFLIPFMQWPEEPRFYFAAVIVGIMFTVGSLILLGLIAQRSGRVAAIYMPLETAVAMLVWVVITPELFETHLSDPLMTAGVLLAWLLGAVALFWIRPNDFNMQTLSIVAPLGMTYAIIGVVTKIVMPADDVIPVALVFILIILATIAVTMLIALGVKKMLRREMVERRVLTAGLVTGLFSVSAYATFVIGVAMAPNPGYVSFMVMLLPVWLLGIHLMRGVQEKSSYIAALMLILSVLILVTATL